MAIRVVSKLVNPQLNANDADIKSAFLPFLCIVKVEGVDSRATNRK